MNRYLLLILCGLLTSCKPKPIELPKWPDKKPIPFTVKQVGSPCGPQLEKEPKTVFLVRDGAKGYWVSERRARCLFARAKIGRTCRDKCFKVVQQHKQSAGFVQDFVSAKYKNAILDLQHKHASQMRTVYIYGSIIVVLAVAGGIVVGVIIK